MTAGPPSGTGSFVFTDAEGSTGLWQDRPKAIAAAPVRHDGIVREAIERHGGCVLPTERDPCAAVFAPAVDAVTAISVARAELSDEPWAGAVIRVRVGLHTGEAEERGGDVVEPVSNRSAHLVVHADGSRVPRPHATTELVRDRRASGAPARLAQRAHAPSPQEFEPGDGRLIGRRHRTAR